jgi:hypothetical protein
MKKAWLNARPVAPVTGRYLIEVEASEVVALRYLATSEPFNAAGAAAHKAAHAKADAIQNIAYTRRAAA